MFCVNCGAKIEESAAFCVKCGTHIDAAGTANEQTQLLLPNQQNNYGGSMSNNKQTTNQTPNQVQSTNAKPPAQSANYKEPQSAGNQSPSPPTQAPQTQTPAQTYQPQQPIYVPTPQPQPIYQPQPPVPPTPPLPYDKPKKKDSLLPLILLLIAVVLVCAALLYLIIAKPWKSVDDGANLNGANNTQGIVTTDSAAKASAAPSARPSSTPSAKPSPSPTPEPEHTYSIVKADATWLEAYSEAIIAGGYLVCINSEEEFNKVTALADENDIKVIWTGAIRNHDEFWDDVKWLSGEKFTYTKWYPGEPTYVSGDDIEDVLALHKIDGVWYFNDTATDVTRYYPGKIGYVIEHE